MPAAVDDLRFAQAAWIDPTARLHHAMRRGQILAA